MKKEKIYISDLDGTLLNEKAELSNFSKRALNRLIKNGINFTIATARSVKSVQQILKGIDLRLPIIEFNGAYITELQSGKHLTINNIPQTTCEELNQLFRQEKLTYLLSSFNGKEDKLYYIKTLNEGQAWYVNDRIQKKDDRLTQIKNLETHFSEKIVCFTCINKKEKLFPLFRELSQTRPDLELHLQENHYSLGWYWLTIHSHLATKDQAIKKLLSDYNLKRENLTVFGDNSNDIKMFKFAKRAIAVENAIPELKEIATETIGKNIDDSVVKYLEKDINI